MRVCVPSLTLSHPRLVTCSRATTTTAAATATTTTTTAATFSLSLATPRTTTTPPPPTPLSKVHPDNQRVKCVDLPPLDDYFDRRTVYVVCCRAFMLGGWWWWWLAGWISDWLCLSLSLSVSLSDCLSLVPFVSLYRLAPPSPSPTPSSRSGSRAATRAPNWSSCLRRTATWSMWRCPPSVRRGRRHRGHCRGLLRPRPPLHLPRRPPLPLHPPPKPWPRATLLSSLSTRRASHAPCSRGAGSRSARLLLLVPRPPLLLVP